MTRITPLEAPFDENEAQVLASMMPAGVPPIGLFRTFVKNLRMTEALRGWGGYVLGPQLTLSMREREIVIDRTTARCGCEYEWGVHVAFFAESVGLDRSSIHSLVAGSSADPCWIDERERLLIDAADELHDEATLSDKLWPRLVAVFAEAEVLDILMLCGWYHAVSFAANGAGVALEPGAPRFADYVDGENKDGLGSEWCVGE